MNGIRLLVLPMFCGLLAGVLFGGDCTAARPVPTAKVASPDPSGADRPEPIALSNRLDTLARAAIVEATRLDVQEAPQREVDRLKKQVDDDRATQDRARLANKPKFRP